MNHWYFRVLTWNCFKCKHVFGLWAVEANRTAFWRWLAAFWAADMLCITCLGRKKNINLHYAKVITKCVQKDEQRLLFKPREPELCLHLFCPLFLQCWRRSESKREDMSACRKLLVSNDVYTPLSSGQWAGSSIRSVFTPVVLWVHSPWVWWRDEMLK